MRIELDGIGDSRRTDIGTSVIEDVDVIRYPSGKVFVRYLMKDFIEVLAKDMHRNIGDHFDNVVVVEGPEGSGKSNLAWSVCKAFDPDFDVTTQYVYSAEDFREKLKQGGDQRGVFWMDEGSNIANNRDWQSVDNKDFVSILEMMRSRGWTLVFCIPTSERLDVYIREHRIRYLLRCGPMQFSKDEAEVPRGYFELKKKDPYGRFRIAGYGKFSPIPDDVKAVYEKMKLEAQQKKIEEVTHRDEKPGAKYKAMYEDSRKQMDEIMLRLYDGKGLDKAHLMDLFGIDNEKTFHNRISKARKREAD